MSTYKPIQHIIVPSTGSFIFSNIPQNYTDLVLVVNGLASSPTATGLRFNGDTSSSYSATYLDGTTAASSYRETNANTGWGGSYYSDRPSSVVINIMNYANTNTNKTFITRYGSGKTIVNITAGLWRKTEAINSINVYTGATFNTTTTATLYGIESALSEQAKATGGDSIYRDSSYWYHIFNRSGTFTPSQNLSNVDYLVVAGGGGGGRGAYGMGGGGGAGGLRSTVTSTGGGGSLESKLSLSAQAYTVTVGAGGTGGAGSGSSGVTGSNSVFSNVTSTGGGGGGGSGYTSPDKNGKVGGSGGGGAGQTNSSGTGGAGTTNQGYAGGNCPAGNPGSGGGGGGGAGAAGGNGGEGNGGSGGSGGNGVSVSITGSSVTYAGGGGGSSEGGSGGTGGSGGGGSGGSGSGGIGSSGSANAGGGGGSGFSAQGNGGSGIVIVRYPV